MGCMRCVVSCVCVYACACLSGLMVVEFLHNKLHDAHVMRMKRLHARCALLACRGALML